MGCLLTVTGCVAHDPIRLLLTPPSNICHDGWPVRILQDPACANGVCGYSCLPDRWRDSLKEHLP